MSKSWSVRKYILYYTLIFLLFALGVFSIFFFTGRSLVWQEDGASQYIPFTAYTGVYLRSYLQNILHGHFEHSMWNFNLGLGTDTGILLRVHRLDALGALLPLGCVEAFYTVLTFVRLYLAGLSFSAFALCYRAPDLQLVCAAMTYIFCGYVFKLGVQHPSFLFAFILLPLVLLGEEQIFRKRGGLLFSFSVFAGFYSFYYFMYMITVAGAIYALLRLPDLYPQKRFSGFVRMLAQVIPPALLGLGMSMALFLPTVLSLRESNRFALQSGPGNLLFYAEPLRRLKSLFLSLISPYKSAGSATYLSYSPVILCALCLLFAGHKKKKAGRPLQIAVILQAVMLMVPFAGYAMAGFSNINNRWVFILSFTLALNFALTDFQNPIPLRGKIALGAVTVLYTLLAVYDHLKNYNPYAFAAAVLLTAMTILLLAKDRIRLVSRTFACLMLLFVFSTCTLYSVMTYHQRYGNLADEYLPAGTALSRITQGRLSSLAQVSSDDTHRADTSKNIVLHENDPLLLNYNGVSINSSLLPPSTTRSLIELENPGLDGLLRIGSLGGGTAASQLSCVKYYLTSDGHENQAPFGFTPDETLSSGKNVICVNEMALDPGYGYDTVLPRPEYEKLSAPEKQQALLAAAVLDECPKGLKEASADDFRLECEELTLPQSGESITFSEDSYRIGNGGGVLTVPITKKAGTEGYLRLSGIRMNTEHSYLIIECEGYTDRIVLRRSGALYSSGLEDFSVCIGRFDEDGPSSVTLTFASEGICTIKNAVLWYAPLADYEKQSEKLKRLGVSSAETGVNSLSGTYESEDVHLLTFAVPYAKGWSAFVDGQKVPLMQVNTGFMGILTSPGEHSYTLHYVSPGNTAGKLISLPCWIIFIVLLVRSHRKRRSCRKH